jgi:transposase
VAAGKKLAAERGAWICFEDEAGHTLRPPKARTWAPRGRTPVIPVSGKGSGRISVAGLVCVKPGDRSRLLYRIKVHRSRKGERRSFAATDYAALLDAAHQYLNAPIVVVWDNLNVHLSSVMRDLVASRDWLHVVQLPAYSPDLNPTEAVRSHVKRSLGNLAVNGVDHLATIVRNRLKRIQYRPDLLTSFLTPHRPDPRPRHRLVTLERDRHQPSRQHLPDTHRSPRRREPKRSRGRSPA